MTYSFIKQPMTVIRYWRNFEVNIDRILRDTDSSIQLLQSYLSALSSVQLERVRSAIKVEKKNLPIDIIGNVLQSPENISLVCLIHFMDLNRKTISHEVGVPIKGDSIDRGEVFTRLVELMHKEDSMQLLYLKQLSVKLGQGFAKFTLPKKPTAEQIQKLMVGAVSISIALGQVNRRGFSYKLRFIQNDNNDLWILIMREVSDYIALAIPNNKYIQSAKPILCRLNLQERYFSVTSRDFREASVIRNYCGRKLEIPMSFEIEEFEVNVENFFDLLLDADGNKAAELQLVKVDTLESLGDLKVSFAGAHSDDKICQRLKILKEGGILHLKNLSEFRGFQFLYKGKINFSVTVKKDKWGNQWLSLGTGQRNFKDVRDFKKSFKKRFAMEFEKRIGGNLAEKGIAQAIIDKQKIEAALPQTVEDIFLRLIEEKIVIQPVNTSKRRCAQCSKISWQLGSCPYCGGDMIIIGDFLKIEHDRNSCIRFVDKIWKEEGGFPLKKRIRTINKKRFEFLVVEEKGKESIWLYLSLGESVEEIAQWFKYTGIPLVFIFLKHGKNQSASLQARGFPCFDLLDFVFESPWERVEKSIGKVLGDLSIKRKEAADLSYERLLNKPKRYSDQDFEQDIYNLLHELFGTADRLGGKFAGVKAPDGVGALTSKSDKRNKRLSLAWDCKFSTSAKGYKLSDNPSKHNHYLRRLSVCKDLTRMGPFRCYLIISQNMNTNSYKNFYQKLVQESKAWKGEIIYVSESALLEIFNFYRSNYNLIERKPNDFYEELLRSFEKTLLRDSEPYPHFSAQKIQELYTKLKSKYRRLPKKLVLDRDVFI